MTDGELVSQALRGQRAAYGELVRRWSPRVLAICHARVANAHAAEDLAQETLLRGLRALPSLESPDRFGSWLHGIAVRVCLDWRKSKQASQVPFTALGHANIDETLLATSENDSAMEVERAEDVQQLMAEIESLNEEHREVLMLYYYQDVTYRDLAELLGVSTATINARLTKARAMLRGRLCGLRR